MEDREAEWSPEPGPERNPELGLECEPERDCESGTQRELEQDPIFDALHEFGDVESAPLGTDGRYADGRIEPATFIYSQVARLAPGPLKKIAPPLVLALFLIGLIAVTIHMITDVDMGWPAAWLRLAAAPFWVFVVGAMAYFGVWLLTASGLHDEGAKGCSRLWEGCLFRGCLAPTMVLASVVFFLFFALEPLVDVPAMFNPPCIELVEVETRVTDGEDGDEVFRLTGVARDGEEFSAVIDQAFYERYRDELTAPLYVKYLPWSDIILEVSPEPFDS